MADTVSEQIAALSDEDWAIREEAATLLGSLNDARAVLPLTKLLRDTDRAVREAAIGSLSALGSASVPALAGCLADPALQVQEAASAILASIADARVFRPLVEALGSRDWIVRMHAAKGLGRIGDPEAVSVLMPLLQDKVKAVREEASSALAAIGAAAVLGLIQALEHDDWLVRLHAVEALGKLKSPDSVDPLLRALFNERDSAIREDVVRALGAIRDARAVDYLVTVMKEPGLRLLAVEALGQQGQLARAVIELDESHRAVVARRDGAHFQLHGTDEAPVVDDPRQRRARHASREILGALHEVPHLVDRSGNLERFADLNSHVSSPSGEFILDKRNRTDTHGSRQGS